MTIEVHVPTMLRGYTGGQKVIDGIGDTLNELLHDLDRRHPGLRSRLVTPEGRLHRFVNVQINDRNVPPIGALSIRIGNDDTVIVLPAVAGGVLGFAAAAALLDHQTKVQTRQASVL